MWRYAAAAAAAAATTAATAVAAANCSDKNRILTLVLKN